MTVGYDKLNLNHQLLLGLTFEEMTGVITHDRAKPIHPCTLHGTPTWNSLGNGLPYLDFNSANPDYLSCPQADTTDLEFDTAGDLFSMAVWLNHSAAAALSGIMSRFVPAATGWEFRLNENTWGMGFLTGQGAVTQLTEANPGSISPGIWHLLSMNRNGADIRLFCDGEDVTGGSPATHLDPVAGATILTIGVRSDISLPFDGQMWYPRIWGRQLAEWEMLEIFQLERHWFL